MSKLVSRSNELIDLGDETVGKLTINHVSGDAYLTMIDFNTNTPAVVVVFGNEALMRLREALGGIG